MIDIGTDAFEGVNRLNMLLKRVESIRLFASVNFASHWPELVPVVGEPPLAST